MVLTVSFVISPVERACCHRRRRDIFRRLDASIAASGPHDFAVRPGGFVRRETAPDTEASIASRTQRPWRSRYAPLAGAGRRWF